MARLAPRTRPLLVAAGLALAFSCGDDVAHDSPGTRTSATSAEAPPAREVAGFPVTGGAAPGYVPDVACRDCHAELFDSYRDVGMARSFYRPDPTDAPEAFGEVFVQEETGFHYQMSVRDGAVYQRRYCVDDRGRRFAEHEEKVDWVVGSGNHARTYLTQNRQGELYELPLTWFAQEGWGMSPGFESPDHERFERLIERNCMFCHNAYPEVPVGNDVAGHSPTFPHDMPEGIGCQRCHGPGAQHVEWATESATGDPQIFNPAHLPPRERDNVCMTCHLQPDVRSGGESIVHRMDRPTYAHRPDQPITDHMVYFDFGTERQRAEKIEINHHAYRMRQSRCYLESDGRLSCVSCHDPHAKPAPAQRAEYFAQKCQQCHQLDDCGLDSMRAPAGTDPTDCVACHMFEARPRDVVETTITDHLIRRLPPAADLTARGPDATRAARLEAQRYFDDRGPEGDLLEIYAGWASGDRRSPERLREWRAAHERQQPDMPFAWVTLSRALAVAGDPAGSLEVIADAVERFPDDASVRYHMGLGLHINGQHAAALPHVEKALSIRTEPRALSLEGNLRALLRQLEPARRALERSLELRPNNTKTWKAYGSVLAELGQLDQAIAAYEKVLALSPDEFDTYFVLRDIYRAHGRLSDMVRILEHGASRSPDVRLELVTTHLVDDPALRDPPAAMAIASAVAAAEPRSGRAHAYLAFAMLLTESSQPAGPLIDRARELGADPACCSGLQVLDALRRRDTEAANRHLARFHTEMRSPSHERLRAPIAQLVQATLR